MEDVEEPFPAPPEEVLNKEKDPEKISVKSVDPETYWAEVNEAILYSALFLLTTQIKVSD